MRQWTIGHILIGGPYEAGWRLSLPLCAARCGGHDLARAALRARTRQRLPRVRGREPIQSCREGPLAGARRWRDPDRKQRHPRLPQRARTVGAADPRRVTGAPGDPQARGDRARHLRAVGQTVGGPPRPGPRERHQAVAGEGGPLRAAPLDAAGITAIVAVELVALINPDLEIPSNPRLAEFVAQHRETPPFAQTRPTL